MKRCSKCDGTKTLASFRKFTGSKDGYDWWCKNCRSDYETARRERLGSTKRLKRRNHDVEESLSLEDIFKDVMNQ